MEEFFLKETAEKIGIKIDEFHMKQFEEFEKILLEWNEKINLTAIIDDKEIIIKHFVDSLTILKYVKNGDAVIDIGTGAGFPGIPLKIMNDSLDVMLLDSLNKRIKYLNEVIYKLNLNKIKTIHARAEELGKDKEYREKYNIVTARAVAKLNVLSEYCLPFVKMGGISICMKGPDVRDELKEAEKQIKVLGGEIAEIKEFVLPETDIKRSVIILKKVNNTPNCFPRRKIN